MKRKGRIEKNAFEFPFAGETLFGMKTEKGRAVSFQVGYGFMLFLDVIWFPIFFYARRMEEKNINQRKRNRGQRTRVYYIQFTTILSQR